MTDKLREKLINGGRVLVDEGQGDYVWGHISARLPDDRADRPPPGRTGRHAIPRAMVGRAEVPAIAVAAPALPRHQIACWPRH